MSFLLSPISPKTSPDSPEKIPGTTPYAANNSRDLGTQILFSLVLGTLGLTFFCILRRKWPNLYSPRCRLKKGAPPHINNSFWGWLPVVLNTSERDILFSVGLDAVVYLRYFKLLISLFSTMAFFGMFVIVPLEAIYKTKSQKNLIPSSPPDPPESFWSNLTSVALGSNQVLIAHLFFGYVFVGLVYFLITRFFYQVLSLRWHYLLHLRNSIPIRTIMVNEIPPQIATAQNLKLYFESVGIGNVQTSCIIPHLSELAGLVHSRAEVLLKIERRYAVLLGNPCLAPEYNPDILTQCFKDSSHESKQIEIECLSKWAKPSKKMTPDKILKWLDETHKLRDIFWDLDSLVLKERNEILVKNNYTPSNVGFVTFCDAKSAQVAAQLSMYSHPIKLKTSLAPEPRDIYWPNITLTLAEKIPRQTIASVFVMVMLLFWLFPITALSSLVSPEFINKYFPGFLDYVTKTPLLNIFLRFTLPSLILYSFNELAPYMLNFLNLASGKVTLSSRQIETLQQYYMFLVVTVLLIFTLTTTIMDKIFEWINDPSKIPKSLADTLPKAAPFFMGYIVLIGVGYFPLKLMRLGTILYTQFIRTFCRSPREYASCYGPEFTNWSTLYPQSMLIFCIAMTYSSLAPLITVFATIYFIIGYISNKYMMLYVYSPPFETAGLHMNKITKNLVTGMLVYLLLMLGIFALRKKYILFTFQLLLLFINTYLMANMSTLFEYNRMSIPLDLLTSKENQGFFGNKNNQESFYPSKGSKIYKSNENSPKLSTPLLAGTSPKAYGLFENQPSTSTKQFNKQTIDHNFKESSIEHSSLDNKIEKAESHASINKDIKKKLGTASNFYEPRNSKSVDQDNFTNTEQYLPLSGDLESRKADGFLKKKLKMLKEVIVDNFSFNPYSTPTLFEEIMEENQPNSKTTMKTNVETSGKDITFSNSNYQDRSNDVIIDINGNAESSKMNQPAGSMVEEQTLNSFAEFSHTLIGQVTSADFSELRWYGNTSEEAISQSIHSDYSQSGMSKCYGVLDSSNQPYMFPQLVGTLPYLWLPIKPTSKDSIDQNF
ncbi:hypothetical protein BB559_003394 [Furculomyces boomerangus]|uniref:CSC1/OSCA1-like 7TM region domain-containing protein n=2 Tax=Harpellales TaxID=61421 RepID=A0A2T9YLI1_9FUNG|nr:hypothetical protein BB559_003394 [Furculomyces boomerangus]PWA03178.1 hypothetical protein BB558_000650 [Smittium angustum]